MTEYVRCRTGQFWTYHESQCWHARMCRSLEAVSVEHFREIRGHRSVDGVTCIFCRSCIDRPPKAAPTKRTHEKTPPVPTERHLAMVRDRRAGMSLKEVARRHGVSSERVRQIVAKTELRLRGDEWHQQEIGLGIRRAPWTQEGDS